MHQAQREDGGAQVRGWLHLVTAPVCRDDQRPGTDATRISIEVTCQLTYGSPQDFFQGKVNKSWVFQKGAKTLQRIQKNPLKRHPSPFKTQKCANFKIKQVPPLTPLGMPMKQHPMGNQSWTSLWDAIKLN